MNDSDSDDDFDTQQTRCKQPSRRERKVVQSAASRLSLAINRARKSLARTRSTNTFSEELGGRFAFASPVSRSSRKSGSKRRNLPPWRVIPCVLPSPDTNKVPVKGTLDALCKAGLGTLWFCKDDQLELPTYLSPDELHFLLLCLYPKLFGTPYEFCKAAGPGNNIIVPLVVEDARMKPSKNREFQPYFTPDRLKEAIGRKGRVYVRPLVAIDIKDCRRLPEHEVSALSLLGLLHGFILHMPINMVAHNVGNLLKHTSYDTRARRCYKYCYIYIYV